MRQGFQPLADYRVSRGFWPPPTHNHDRRNRVFSHIFVSHQIFSKKPGFWPLEIAKKAANSHTVQNWLQDKPSIKNRYNAKLMKADEVKLPNQGKSPTKPGE
jgi:hypothetical protein